MNTTLDPTTRAFLDAVNSKGGPALKDLPLPDARRVLTSAQAVQVEKPQVEIEEATVPCEKYGDVPVRIVRPKGASRAAGAGGILPGVIYLHGGGWVLGDWSTHDRLVRELAVGAGATLIFVEYTRSPEARYPAAAEQAYAATKWAADNAGTVGIHPAKLAVAGDSVGGNLAAAVTLLAKSRGGPKIGMQVLFYPVTDAGMDTPSYTEFAEGHFLTRDSMRWFWEQYAPDASVRGQPLASPLKTPAEHLRNLPRALVITAEADVLRDEGEAYARKLMTAGVPVTATRYLGAIHDFVMLNSLATSPPTRAAIAQACGLLRAAWSV
jgi:acetyl esterase/lipase